VGEALYPSTRGRAPAHEQPAHALRAALDSPWPELRNAAVDVIRRAIFRASTIGEVSVRLGVSRRSLERLRRDFPESFERATKPTFDRVL
jgi:AraC-like DNA-binding protein